MKRASQYLLCLLAALQLGGGHLGVMQIVAWAQMIRDYSSRSGLIEGVKQTFDGEHPCPRCRQIAAAKHQEERKSPLPLEKFERLSQWVGLLPEVKLPRPSWRLNEEAFTFVDAALTLMDRGDAPPTPPPRAQV